MKKVFLKKKKKKKKADVSAVSLLRINTEIMLSRLETRIALSVVTFGHSTVCN